LKWPPGAATAGDWAIGKFCHGRRGLPCRRRRRLRSSCATARPWISLAAEPAARGKGLPRRPLRTANFAARPCREFGCPWQRPATASGPRGKALPATPTKKPCVWPGERLPRARGKVLPRAQASSRARPPVGWPGCPRRGRGGPGKGLSRACRGSGRRWQGLATDPAARGKARVEALPGARPPAAQPCHGPGRPPRNAAAGHAARGKALPLAWQSVATGSGAHGHGPAVRGNSLRRARSSVARPRRGPGRRGKALPRARQPVARPCVATGPTSRASPLLWASAGKPCRGPRRKWQASPQSCRQIRSFATGSATHGKAGPTRRSKALPLARPPVAKRAEPPMAKTCPLRGSLPGRVPRHGLGE
jgi:hypothetical protein